MARRRRTRRRQSTTHARIESLEDRKLLSGVEFAAIDGVGNNVENPELGSTHEALLRTTSVEYEDGLDSPGGVDRPSARAVSNAVAAQDALFANDRGLTDIVWLWGQFVDHDIDLTEGADPAEAFDIEVPAGDPLFDPFGTGAVTIGLNRSVYEYDEDGVRQQINTITAFIDGSMVYGSDPDTAASLREFDGGRLLNPDGLLPVDGGGFFMAGDVRANENVALTSMHTLWVREHNRLADEIGSSNPSLSDEEIFQQARRIVIAEIQAITYNEFLPALLGGNAPGEYQGYDSSVDPSIANEFSTAAYRLGHSLLSPTLQRLDADGNVIADGNLALRDAFFNPQEIVDHGIDSLLRGATNQLAQELDTQIVDDVRNFLFGPPGAGGFDLASLNIQRGRDHGLADYNQVREDLGLERVTSFEEISSNPDVVAALQSVYSSVDEIDLWVGGLAEDHLPGSSLGETFTTIVADQFERLRDGDRFWYQNTFHGRELAEIESTTLADVIERNTDITGLRENVFFGDSVLFLDVDAPGVRRVEITTIGDDIAIVDHRGHVLASGSAEEISQVVVQGGHDTHLEVTIGAGINGDLLPAGIELLGGDGRRDSVVLVDPPADVTDDGATIIAGSFTIAYSGLESVDLDGNERPGRGDDHGRPGRHDRGGNRDRGPDHRAPATHHQSPPLQQQLANAMHRRRR